MHVAQVALVLLALDARPGGVDHESDPGPELIAAASLLDRVIDVGPAVDSAAVDDASDAEPSQLARECRRRADLLLERRYRQLRVQPAERSHAAHDPERPAVAVAIERHRSDGVRDLARQTHRLHRKRVEHPPLVLVLDDDGVAWRDPVQLLKGGAAPLGELVGVPGADDPDPGSERPGLSGIADEAQALLEIVDPLPPCLVVPRQAGSHAVD